ncbi:MAG: hypothetical protein CO162_02685 [bacterium (Candidatus Ratteibacteria) CG_4_9_14_3_um_filter_41_21]|uniref:Uncharacterized protein n=1 Tax=bacterium (Candidatus Ratteibacteria) CG_4_9_14_3_um_filter_41_21 TaxID=2014289 RepID=A0A2M7YGM8_9BACT|nr:MAG: hypothetical protein CO162_02685 [bacterium (Candidatus Ratteibacteria) CG_4_9_14_3_um_filter_41_21]
MRNENVNDFDIQLFAGDEDPSGETIPLTEQAEVSLPAKIKVGDGEFTVEELQAMIKDSQNSAEWKKANTVTAQQLAEERKILETEQQKFEGWKPVIAKYEEDEAFQQSLNDLLENKQSNDFEMGEKDPQLISTQNELSTLRKELENERAIRLAKEQTEEGRMIEIDRSQIAAKIKTSGDVFTYEDVEKFATENLIPVLSVAYDILRGSDANIAHHVQTARAAALAEYEKKAPPRIAPMGGQGGIVGQETVFTNFRDAAIRAAAKYPNVFTE